MGCLVELDQPEGYIRWEQQITFFRLKNIYIAIALHNSLLLVFVASSIYKKLVANSCKYYIYIAYIPRKVNEKYFLAEAWLVSEYTQIAYPKACCSGSLKMISGIHSWSLDFRIRNKNGLIGEQQP